VIDITAKDSLSLGELGRGIGKNEEFLTYEGVIGS